MKHGALYKVYRRARARRRTPRPALARPPPHRRHPRRPSRRHPRRTHEPPRAHHRRRRPHLPTRRRRPRRRNRTTTLRDRQRSRKGLRRGLGGSQKPELPNLRVSPSLEVGVLATPKNPAREGPFIDGLCSHAIGLYRHVGAAPVESGKGVTPVMWLSPGIAPGSSSSTIREEIGHGQATAAFCGKSRMGRSRARGTAEPGTTAFLSGGHPHRAGGTSTLGVERSGSGRHPADRGDGRGDRQKRPRSRTCRLVQTPLSAAGLVRYPATRSQRDDRPRRSQTTRDTPRPATWK